MRYLIIGALGLAVFLAGPASASYIGRPASNANPNVAAGLVEADGHILRGVGFRVHHGGTGEYTITFDRGYLGSECAEMVVTPARGAFAIGSTTPNVCQPSAVFSVDFQTASGTPVDVDFNFVAVEAAFR